MPTRTVGTWDRLEDILASKRIDRANRYRESDRGFNTTKVAVKSDRPSGARLWEDGCKVSWQRVTMQATSTLRAYAKRMADLRPLPYRKHGYESHYNDVGSTFRPVRQRGMKRPRKGTSRSIAVFVNAKLGTGSIEAMLFGV
jgi:hypothetical protein